MEFSGPAVDDYANVGRLNHAFLLRMRNKDGESLRNRLPGLAATLLPGLSDLQIEWLSEAPFLLLSLRERDEDYWRLLSGSAALPDLFDPPAARRQPDPLAAAALSFLWQLALRNPYATRLVSGAPLSWCETVSGCLLVDVLQRVAIRDDCLEPRLGHDEFLWNKLLGPGVSSNDEVRRAAHLAALQAVLTADPMSGFTALRPAACSLALPSMSVADAGERS